LVACGVVFDLDEALLDRSASLWQHGHCFWTEFRHLISRAEHSFVEEFVKLDGNGYMPRKDFFSLVSAAIDSTNVSEGVVTNGGSTNFRFGR
jgi:hypothetical protein